MVTTGEAFVAGLTSENANKLLDRAAALGLPASVVRTVGDGFVVPVALIEEETPKRRTPRKKSDQSAASAGEE